MVSTNYNVEELQKFQNIENYRGLSSKRGHWEPVLASSVNIEKSKTPPTLECPRFLGSPVLGGSGLVTGLAVKCCSCLSCTPRSLGHHAVIWRRWVSCWVTRSQLSSTQSSPEAPAPAQVSAGPEALARPVLAMEAPNALDVEPDSDDDWKALLDAHGIVTPADGAAAAVAQSANATGAGRRARDKRRRRSRKSAKRSMWREI